jgi:quercetin dioxygenase-like cupin family protein
MDMHENTRGHAIVMQPDEGPSFWQPVPANGHADPKLTPAVTKFAGLSMGYQTVAPGGRVRSHSHGQQVELQICFKGQGSVIVDGKPHPLVPGTACFLGCDVNHEIVNTGPDELVMLWVISPPGLEDFFQTIGRPRRIGDVAPEPFARPTDVVAIERSLGMDNTTDGRTQSQAKS